MGTPTTFRDYRLSSAAFEETELMVGKCANRLRAVPFLSILLSGTRQLSPSGRFRERRPALSRFASSPTIKSVLSIAGEFRRPSRSVVGVLLEIPI
jgi:hypothetical protein